MDEDSTGRFTRHVTDRSSRGLTALTHTWYGILCSLQRGGTTHHDFTSLRFIITTIITDQGYRKSKLNKDPNIKHADIETNTARNPKNLGGHPEHYLR